MSPWFRIIRADLIKNDKRFPQEIIAVEDIPERDSCFYNGGVAIPFHTEENRIHLDLAHASENGGQVIIGDAIDGIDLIKKAQRGNELTQTLKLRDGQTAFSVKLREEDDTHSVEYHTRRPVEFGNLRRGGSKEVK